MNEPRIVTLCFRNGKEEQWTLELELINLLFTALHGDLPGNPPPSVKRRGQLSRWFNLAPLYAINLDALERVSVEEEDEAGDDDQDAVDGGSGALRVGSEVGPPHPPGVELLRPGNLRRDRTG